MEWGHNVFFILEDALHTCFYFQFKVQSDIFIIMVVICNYTLQYVYKDKKKSALFKFRNNEKLKKNSISEGIFTYN